jgi:DNA-binding response OmpR family regulator
VAVSNKCQGKSIVEQDRCRTRNQSSALTTYVSISTPKWSRSTARVHLTDKEYQMLELLALRKGTTLNKEMFLSHLYGGMDKPEMKIIDVFVCKLRKSSPTHRAFHTTRFGRVVYRPRTRRPIDGLLDLPT